jgi:predicted O-methyltransferase YrrM
MLAFIDICLIMIIKELKMLDNILKVTFNLIITRPWQIMEEIKKLLLILDKVKPKVILEIGTAGGGTYSCFRILQMKKLH